jgi:multidrug efflux pump subunit AcrA (membrane-fusion protein)
LPPPPEEEAEIDVLLRPGLLADIEIIVEKLENKVYIPAQAVFNRAGKPVVFVQTADKQFVPRPVTLLKQSESTMVIQDGLKEGEIIALSDPTAGQSKKKEPEKKSEGGAGAMGPG